MDEYFAESLREAAFTKLRPSKSYTSLQRYMKPTNHLFIYNGKASPVSYFNAELGQ